MSVAILDHFGMLALYCAWFGTFPPPWYGEYAVRSCCMMPIYQHVYMYVKWKPKWKKRPDTNTQSERRKNMSIGVNFGNFRWYYHFGRRLNCINVLWNNVSKITTMLVNQVSPSSFEVENIIFVSKIIFSRISSFGFDIYELMYVSNSNLFGIAASWTCNCTVKIIVLKRNTYTKVTKS